MIFFFVKIYLHRFTSALIFSYFSSLLIYIKYPADLQIRKSFPYTTFSYSSLYYFTLILTRNKTQVKFFVALELNLAPGDGNLSWDRKIHIELEWDPDIVLVPGDRIAWCLPEVEPVNPSFRIAVAVLSEW